MFFNNTNAEKPIQYLEVFGNITVESSRDFIKDFLYLEMSGQPFIPIIINCYGGCACSTLGMIDIIEQCEKPVYTIINGCAYSGGAWIAVAGHDGCRYMAPSSVFLVHEGSTVIAGKQTDINATNKYMNEEMKRLLQYISKRCGKKKNYFKRLLKKKVNIDLYYTAKQAKKLGAIDHIGYPKFSRVETFEICEKI